MQYPHFPEKVSLFILRRIARASAHNLTNRLSRAYLGIDLAKTKLHDPAKAIESLDSLKGALDDSLIDVRQLSSWAKGRLVEDGQSCEFDMALSAAIGPFKTYMGADITINWEPGADGAVIGLPAHCLDEAVLAAMFVAKDTFDESAIFTLRSFQTGEIKLVIESRTSEECEMVPINKLGMEVLNLLREIGVTWQTESLSNSLKITLSFPEKS